MLILTEYEKEYPSFFQDDMMSIPSSHFIHRIYTLTGHYGNILKERQKLVSGVKLEKEERAYAMKFITPAIEEYLDRKRDQANDAYAENLMASIRHSILGGDINGKN